MASIAMCDACGAEPAFLLVTMDVNGPNTMTVGVGLQCEEGFHMMRMEQLSLMHPPSEEDAEGAPEPAEALEEPEGTPDALREFPGTQRVVKSTHGHRKPASSRQSTEEQPAQASEA
jgi:hypothetical protein